MKIKGKIFQLIKWEEKEKYFRYTDFGDIECDLIHLAPLDEDKLRWYENVLPFPFSIGKRKPLKYHNFPFTQEIYDKKGRCKYSGLPILAERPNKLKEGDIVELDIKVSLSKTTHDKKGHTSDNRRQH